MENPKEYEEVTITDPEGNVLSDTDTQELLQELQQGVFYCPQERR